MSRTLNDDLLDGTDQFNRRESQLANHGRERVARIPDTEQGPLRVLIVDDDRDTADVMALLVRRWGHAAQRTYDGGSALSAAARQTPEVMLLDIAMPHLNGCQIAERVRGDARLRDCFLIAITGCADPATREKCRAAGIDLFFIKPVEPSILETVLYLESRRLGRSQPETGSGVTPRISAAGRFVAAWEVVPRSTVTTAVGL